MTTPTSPSSCVQVPRPHAPVARAELGGRLHVFDTLEHIEPPVHRGPRDWPKITARESEVLRLTAQGKRNKDIAETLGISVKTVEVHKTNATRKLNLHSRIDVIRYAVLQGWLKEV